MPIFEPKNIVGAILAKKKGKPMEDEEMPEAEEGMEGEEMPEAEEGMEGEEGSEDEGLKQCAMELIDAVKGGDVDSVVGALRSAFHILDAEPHEEGEHTGEGEEEEMPEEEGEE